MVLLADLVATEQDECLQSSPMIRALYTAETMEGFFTNDFQKQYFRDLTREVRNLFLQMRMDGSFCSCISPGDMPALRKAKPGYGVWIWKKN
jgi:hypothetical protein